MLRSPPRPGRAVQRDQGTSLLGVGDRLGPVADGAREVGSAAEVEDVGEVTRRREQRPAALVHHRDALGRCRSQGVLDVLAALVGAAGGVEGGAGGVLGVAGDEPVAQPAVEPVGAGDHGQRAGHHRRVAVDPRRVDDAAEARPVELGRGHRAVLDPVVLLPVEREDRAATATAPGVLDGPQCLRDGGGAGEVDAAQPHPGVREVRVGVDEGRQHQGTLEVDDGIDDVGVATGALLVADPAEPVVDDHEGRRVRPVWGADPPAAVERRRHGATLGAGRSARRRRAPRARPRLRWSMAIPHAVGKLNKVATNKVLVHLAGHGPFVELEHVGRRSGRVYRVPLNAFRTGDSGDLRAHLRPPGRLAAQRAGGRWMPGPDGPRDPHPGRAGGPADRGRHWLGCRLPARVVLRLTRVDHFVEMPVLSAVRVA